MNNDPLSDAKIVDSWNKNASAWVAAVRGGLIESRRQVTDDAIIEAVMSCVPRTVLDIGCGEGWLARSLAEKGVAVVGIDAVSSLVEQARRGGGGTFHTLSYEDLAAGALRDRADVIVSNFALLGNESVNGVVRVARTLLNPGGSLVVQTLHPAVSCGALPYRDGWREGSWDGFGSAFTDPAPWYFRTLQSWTRLFADSGLRLRALREPLSPATGKPASIIFVASPTGQD